MDEQTELLRELRDLLRIIAEPALAKRDEARRTSLSAIVGKSKGRSRAVILMDGSRLQKKVCEEAKIDPGDMSRLVKALREKGLLSDNEKQPKLLLDIPSNYFEGNPGATNA